MNIVHHKAAAILHASTLAICLSLPLMEQARGSDTPAQIARDLAARVAEINWPQGYVPEAAQLFAHNEIVIDAPCSRVWTHLVDAPRWPTWYENSKDVRIANGEPRLTEKSHFAWSTFGLPIQSSIFEFEPGRRLAWFGHGPGMHAYHTWYLADHGKECKVVTEEVTNGPAAGAWRKNDPGALHQAHDAWLAGLKRVAQMR